MMKKTAATLLTLALTLSLAGCSGGAAASSKITDGTYTGTGQGKVGEIKVEVVVTDQKIDRINVLEQNETPGVSDPAFADIPPAVISSQSLAVDTIAGATLSSAGILEAVEAALLQAGFDAEALKAKAAD